MQKNALAYFFTWYFWQTPKNILVGWKNILWYNLEYFSFVFLLQTLFSPWRRIAWSAGKGFNPSKLAEAIIGNLISRVLGALIRSSLILLGIAAELLIFLLGPLVLVSWFVFPAVLVFALFQGVFIKEFPSTQAYVFLGAFLIGTLWLLRSFWQEYTPAKPLPKTKSLAKFIQKESRVRPIFQRLLLDYKEIASQLSEAKAFLSLAKSKTPEEVLIQATKENTAFQKILIQAGSSPKDLEAVALWFLENKKAWKEHKQWWSQKNLKRYASIGRNWASGFSPLLDEFSQDISEQQRLQGFPKLINHEQELKSIERVLARDQINNVLLVGEPGSGKKSLVERIATKSILGESLPKLNYKRFLQLDIPALLARIESPAQRETALETIFQEVVQAGNIVLVIEDFHNFVGKTGPGTINITGVLAKYLSLPAFPIIALTTFTGLRRDIEHNASLLSLLEKVQIQEITKEQALQVILELIPVYESKYKVFIPYNSAYDIVDITGQYIQATPFPKKALDLLDEAMVLLSQNKNRVLMPKHIADIVSEKTNIPIGELQTKEKEILLNLEDLLHKKVINQVEAIHQVASSLQRARTQVAKKKGPMGSFLFMGPTGVGKTETAKALAATYFGSEQRMIRLDMSEFQNVQDIPRFLGTIEQDGLLTTPVRQNPFSLVLLDELEKAHPNILNLFLQVLDEGNITDGVGRKIDFTHTIIIATSNAGSQLILQAIKGNKDFTQLKQEVIDHVLNQGIFRPEFINRFDATVLFTPLTPENLIDIAGLMMTRLQKGIQEKGIEFVVSKELKASIAKLGYNPQFGARDMKRVMQDKVENALAKALLRNEIQRGDTIELDPKTFTIHKK